MNNSPRLLLLLLMALMTTMVQAGRTKYPGGRCYIYRYYLHDKQGGTHTLHHPARFLSHRAIERRKRQGLPIDSTDLPIPQSLLKQFQVKGAEIVGTSRWNNTVLVRARDTLLLAQLSTLPCVKEWRHVWTSPDSIEHDIVQWRWHESFNKWDSVKNDPYGMGRPQIERLRGDRLHDIDLRGEGMTIAVLDGGFKNAHHIPALSHHIVGAHNFVPCPLKGVEEDELPYQFTDHGTRVLSAMATQAPEVLIGTAPQARYWLLRCEETDDEQPVEEDYWAMAAEFADSVGADIISSSLGYNEFGHPWASYRLQDLDGQTALISRTASMLARKGIILVNSAGNSGMGPWKKICVPADAHDILTVGALDNNGHNAAFSSVGPTQDGRVKPDVMALGAPATLISGRGLLVHDMGTSFSTPVVAGLVACLWQDLRSLSAIDIIHLVRQSCNMYNEPDNVYGYGTPNFWRAYMIGKAAVAASPRQQPLSPTP